METIPAKAQVELEVSTYVMPQLVTGEGNIGFHCERDTLNRTTTNVHDNTIVNSSSGIMPTNELSIVQVIDTNTLRWFGLVMMRKEESMLRVVKDEWKETKRKDYVAREHRSPLERIEHISERSPPNEMFRE